MKNYIIEDQFKLQVARGKIKGATVINIFGHNNSQGTDFRTVWEKSDTTGLLKPASALQMTVTSDICDTSDDGVIIRVIGLDANYDVIAENVTLNNATPPTTTNSFLRINTVVTISGNATGNVSVSNGGNEYAHILAGTGKNQASIYTVPAGYSFYLYRIDGFMNDAASAKSGEFRNKSTLSSGVVLRVADTPFINQMNIQRRFPFKYGEKTDIEFQIRSLSGTNYCGVFGEGIQIKDDTPIPGNTDYLYFP